MPQVKIYTSYTYDPDAKCFVNFAFHDLLPLKIAQRSYQKNNPNSIQGLIQTETIIINPETPNQFNRDIESCILQTIKRGATDLMVRYPAPASLEESMAVYHFTPLQENNFSLEQLRQLGNQIEKDTVRNWIHWGDCNLGKPSEYEPIKKISTNAHDAQSAFPDFLTDKVQFSQPIIALFPKIQLSNIERNLVSSDEPVLKKAEKAYNYTDANEFIGSHIQTIFHELNPAVLVLKNEANDRIEKMLELWINQGELSPIVSEKSSSHDSQSNTNTEMMNNLKMKPDEIDEEIESSNVQHNAQTPNALPDSSNLESNITIEDPAPLEDHKKEVFWLFRVFPSICGNQYDVIDTKNDDVHSKRTIQTKTTGIGSNSNSLFSPTIHKRKKIYPLDIGDELELPPENESNPNNAGPSNPSFT